MRRWLYPGTFDPATKGHMDLIRRALPLCDELVIAVAENREKSTFFSLEERLFLVQRAVTGLSSVLVTTFNTLLTEQVQKYKVDAVLRGVRAFSDFEYEFVMALTNRKLLSSFETIFMMPSEPYIYLSSSLVKEILAFGGDASAFMTTEVLEAMETLGDRSGKKGE